MQAIQMRVLRWIEWVLRLDIIRNVDLRGRLNQEGFLDCVKRQQLNWKQRLEQMSSSRVTKNVCDGEIPRKCPRGSPEGALANFTLLLWSLLYIAKYVPVLNSVLDILFACTQGNLPRGRYTPYGIN